MGYLTKEFSYTHARQNHKSQGVQQVKGKKCIEMKANEEGNLAEGQVYVLRSRRYQTPI